MATGWTTTGSLTDSLPTVISAARIIREQEGGIQQLCRRETLGEGIGLSWNEVSFAALAAQRVTENTLLENFQQLSDSLMTITPTVIGCSTFITDRVAARIAKVAYAQIGSLGQNAMERLKDQDGITVGQTGGTTASPGAGNALTTGNIGAAKSNISSNTTEPGKGPFRAVLHGFQIKDLWDQMVAGVGTVAIPEGPTARVLTTGFKLPIADVEIYENGNITIDSSDDAIGFVFAKEGIIYVQGRSPWVKPVRMENKGGGGTAIYHYDEYAYGLGNSTYWCQILKSDATAPTS